MSPSSGRPAWQALTRASSAGCLSLRGATSMTRARRLRHKGESWPLWLPLCCSRAAARREHARLERHPAALRSFMRFDEKCWSRPVRRQRRGTQAFFAEQSLYWSRTAAAACLGVPPAAAHLTRNEAEGEREQHMSAAEAPAELSSAAPSATHAARVPATARAAPPSAFGEPVGAAAG